MCVRVCVGFKVIIYIPTYIFIAQQTLNQLNSVVLRVQRTLCADGKVYNPAAKRVPLYKEILLHAHTHTHSLSHIT